MNRTGITTLDEISCQSKAQLGRILRRAKQDNALTRLHEENTRLVSALEDNRKDKMENDEIKWQEMAKKLDALTRSLKTMPRKDRG